MATNSLLPQKGEGQGGHYRPLLGGAGVCLRVAGEDAFTTSRYLLCLKV